MRETQPPIAGIKDATVTLPLQYEFVIENYATGNIMPVWSNPPNSRLSPLRRQSWHYIASSRRPDFLQACRFLVYSELAPT